jgi:rhamnogalacturonyl hydrolase YesR
MLAAVAATQAIAQTKPAAPPWAAGSRSEKVGLTRLPVDAASMAKHFGAWPSTDPKVVGSRLTLNLLARPPVRGGWKRDSGMNYADAATVYGALRFAAEINDRELGNRVAARYAVLLTPAGKEMIPPAIHVDGSVFGIVPLEIYRFNKDKAFLDIGKRSADAQWDKPDRKLTPYESARMASGLSWQTRYWIDDMFMICVLQVQAFRATGDKIYLDRAAAQMAAYLRMQQPNGLFFHGSMARFHWGRGNGWMAVGMTEVLSDLPADHPRYPAIMQAYKSMMAALLKHQGEDGMWRQLIDHPESYAETSSTGMFIFALGEGVNRGWLPAGEYKEPVKKAWAALCVFLDENANVREVCEGTAQSDQMEYYLKRPRLIGDPHGQAAAIWAAWAMEKLAAHP